MVTREFDGVTCCVRWRRESGPILWLSPASFSLSHGRPDSNDVCQRLHTAILTESQAVAARHGGLPRVVLMSGDPELDTQRRTLAACGFVPGALVVEFRRDAGCPVPLAGEKMSVSEWHVDSSWFRQSDAFDGELIEPLQRILDSTPQIAGLPRPHASELVVEWTDPELVYVALRNAGNCIGLAVGMPIPAGPRRICSEFGTAIERPHMEIRFFGVLPEFRRRGAARHLLCAMSSLVPADGARFDRDRVGMSAWCDSSNAAAVGFYTRCGFAQVNSAELWVG
jgi:ribosomal protein S18 acetylase RimI-like enzyme